MGIKRIVDTSFWTDGKVDEFSPEDKYFMLYLLTNPFSTQLGIYEISIKQVAFQLGYSMDAVKVLIDRFESKYKVIIYSKETGEIAIKNFLRHSIVKGGAPVRDCLIKELKQVKNRDLIAQVFAHIKDREGLNETVRKIIDEYEEKNGSLSYSNKKENDNENENDNEVSYPDSSTIRERIVNESSKTVAIDYQQIADLYNSICVSFPSVKTLSEARKKAIKARLNTYSIEDFKTMFEKAEASSFLKGSNGNNWSANFDWMLKDANMAKILDGNYDDRDRKGSGSAPKQTAFNTYQQRNDVDYAAIERMAQAKLYPPKTAGEDPELMARAEDMRRRLAN